MPSRMEQLRQMLEAEPNDAFCLYSMALEHAKIGEHGPAIEWFDRALAADPNSCYAYYHKARSQAELGLPSQALETLQRGLVQARAVGDAKAMSELSALHDELEG